MPAITLELTYLLPVYQHVTIQAASVEDACRIALEQETWEHARNDYDSSGPTFVNGIWRGHDAAYSGKAARIPMAFREERRSRRR